jgi:hypothetical protein
MHRFDESLGAVSWICRACFSERVTRHNGLDDTQRLVRPAVGLLRQSSYEAPFPTRLWGCINLSVPKTTQRRIASGTSRSWRNVQLESTYRAKGSLIRSFALTNLIPRFLWLPPAGFEAGTQNGPRQITGGRQSHLQNEVSQGFPPLQSSIADLIPQRPIWFPKFVTAWATANRLPEPIRPFGHSSRGF